MMNRRHFVKRAVMAGVGVAALQRRAWPFAQSPTNIRKFAVSLPGLGPSAKNEIGQSLPLATKRSLRFTGQQTDLYNIAAAAFSQRMHRDLPGKTNFFGYTDLSTFDQKYLGGAIVASKNTPVLLTVTNLLPRKHILPVDPTIMAGPTAAMRNAVSPRTGGHEYVWHRHILEHEEHDMMRPLVVR